MMSGMGGARKPRSSCHRGGGRSRSPRCAITTSEVNTVSSIMIPPQHSQISNENDSLSRGSQSSG